MAVTADVLRRLGKLRLDPEALEEVLAIIADIQSVDEERKAKQRERTAKHRTLKRDGNVTVTVQSRDKDVTLPPRDNNSTPHQASDPSVPSGSASDDAAQPDPRRELFGRGKQTVKQITGRSLEGCGSLIGKWLRIADDSAVIVLAVIDEAAARELAAPIPWIEQSIRSEAKRNGSGASDLFGGGAARRERGGTVQSSLSAAVARHTARDGLGPGRGANDHRHRNGSDHGSGGDDPEIEDAEWSPAESYRAAHH